MPPMCFRPYEPEKDKDAVHRIWREIGWIEPGHEPRLDLFLQAGRTLVAEVEHVEGWGINPAPAMAGSPLTDTEAPNRSADVPSEARIFCFAIQLAPSNR